MINCYHCGKQVIQEDEKGYEICISRWTMDFPNVREFFHWHEECWRDKFKANYITLPSSMEDLFGQFIEPDREKAVNKRNKETLDSFFGKLSK